MKQPDLTPEEMREYIEGLAEGADLVPRMSASSFVLAVVDASKPDVMLALQVGMCLLLDKPLIILADKKVWIPARLRNLAEAIVEMEDGLDDVAKEKLKAVIGELTKRKATH